MSFFWPNVAEISTDTRCGLKIWPNMGRNRFSMADSRGLEELPNDEWPAIPALNSPITVFGDFWPKTGGSAVPRLADVCPVIRSDNYYAVHHA